MARSDLEEGAFLFLEKPITIENVMYLWQHVRRKKTWKIKAKEQLREIVAYNTMCSDLWPKKNFQWKMLTLLKKGTKGDESSKKSRTRKA